MFYTYTHENLPRTVRSLGDRIGKLTKNVLLNKWEGPESLVNLNVKTRDFKLQILSPRI